MKTQLTQGEAVFVATTEYLEAEGIEFTNQPEELKGLMGKDARAAIVDRVFTMFKTGEVTFKSGAKHDTDAKVRSYVTGLVSNWHRKDKRLNGGVAYVPKNPGSRPSDPTLRNLRALKIKFASDAEKIEAIDEAIQAREAELEAAKPKESTVDLTKVPSDLLSKLGLN